METKKNKEEKINSLSDTDKEALKIIVSRLTNLQSKDSITEDSVKELETVLIELLGMKDRHQGYLLRWVKQGYILD